MSNLKDITSNIVTNTKDLARTLIKPATNFGTSLIINKFYFTDSTITIGGIKFNQQIFYSIVNTLISYFQENLRAYILPTFIEKQLIEKATYLISPTICGIGVMLSHEIITLMREGYSLSAKALLYSFFIGMISELIANYIYENVIRIIADKMFV